jgi:hypothetical protein
MSEELWAGKIKVFRLLLEATRAGKVRWVDNGNDVYHSDDLPGCYIKFFSTRCEDREVAFADPDQVEIGLERTSGLYYVGSQGYSLAVAILAAALPKWREGRTSLMAGVEEALGRLEGLLSNGGA